MPPITYRHLPTQVQALQYLGDSNLDEVELFCPNIKVSHSGPEGPILSIPTLEGSFLVEPGMFIVRGTKQEFYSIQKDIFRSSYEPI